VEHDAWDRLPTKPVVVVLCRACGDRLIEPHPRLYTKLDAGAPFPGCMGICLDCRYREGVACSSPLARVNGGAGVELEWEKEPIAAHLNYGGGRSEFKHIYSGPAIACSGKVAA